jgi:hypothetical protein
MRISVKRVIHVVRGQRPSPHLLFNSNTTTGATSVTGTAYPSGTPEMWVAQSKVLSLMFLRSHFVLLNIKLSFLRFKASDYPFGIFKLFLCQFVQFTCNHYILDNIHYVSFLIKIRLINDETDILYQWMY